LPKTRASFLKRQREMAKKEQRAAKLQRKLDRKAQAGEPAEPADSEAPQHEASPAEVPGPTAG
jgi:hypothetical protein